MRIKLSLHNHSQMSDGYFTVSGLLKVLNDAKFDVVAITDHNTVTVPHTLQICGAGDMLILRGVEVTFPRMHIISIEPSVTNMGLIGLVRSAAVSWLAHPIFSQIFPPWPSKIVEREKLDGIELYCGGHIAYKGDFDGPLYAVDDLHIPSHINTSWMEMDVDSKDKDTILEKLKSGDFEVVNT